MEESALRCLGVLELERLWPARSCDVGTSRALVVARSVVRRPWKACAAFLVQNGSAGAVF